MSQEIIEGYRLSPQQRRLWLLRQSDRCAQCAVRIDGELHVEVLEEAFRQVVSQHESLRTSFKLLGGMTIPVQVISDRPDVLFKRYDLQQLTAEQQDSRVKLIFDDIAIRKIEYDQLPLLHCDLIELSPNKHDLIISLPVACADAPSLHCLVHQIADAYQAVSQAEKPSPIDTMQYADFSEWQNELLEAQSGLAGQYWRQQSLTEFDAQKLPFEKRSVSAEIFQPATLSVEISAATGNRIKKTANSCDVSTSAFALACYQILLSRLTGSSSVVIGVALDGRKFAELTKSIGLFSIFVPLRTDLPSDLAFEKLLKQTSDQQREARRWQEYFMREARATGENVMSPFFAFCFEFRKHAKTFSASNLEFSVYENEALIDRFKINFTFEEYDGHFSASLQFDESLFSIDDVQQIADQLKSLIEDVTNRPEATLGELNL